MRRRAGSDRLSEEGGGPSRRPSGDDRGARGGAARGSASERWPRRQDLSPEEERAPKRWGSLARRGTRQLNQPGAGPASEAWRQAVERARGLDGPGPHQDTWIRDEPAVTAAAPAKPAAARPAAPRGSRRPKRLPPEIGSELTEAVGSTRATRLASRLAEATKAYERDRYRDVVRIVKPLAEAAPGAAAVRELYGLARYRLGHWNEAIRELEAFRALTGSFDQHPTLADCYRAKKRWREVDALWEELKAASPSPELVAEGRIVVAGALADRGRVAEAIEVLERAKTDLRRPREHHLRIWYALGDLYERAGELTRAREFFRRVLEFDPDLYDTAERLAAIG